MLMRFMRPFLFAAIAASLGVASVRPGVRAQEGDGAAGDSALYRVDAARLRWTTEDGERVIYLEGGVRIEHQTTTITSVWGKHYPSRRYVMLHDSVRVVDGTTEMKSDEGEYFGQSNTIVLRGTVRIRDEGWHARCDRATYNRTTRIAVMTGNLSLADSTRTLYADTIVYDRFRETADARGRVVLSDETEDYSIAGAHARYDRIRRSAVVDVDPVLTFDLHAEERGSVTSRLMHFDVDRRLGIAEGDVRMAKGETRASCDSAAIYDEEGRIELYGKPEASNGPTSMSGSRMILWYGDDAVRRIVLPAEGRIAESPREGSPWRDDSWIEGDSIAVHLSDERVDSVRIERSARAMYYPTEETERKVSNNYSAGERMFFAFRDGALSYLRIDGKSTGLYKFLHLGAADLELVRTILSGIAQAGERFGRRRIVAMLAGDVEDLPATLAGLPASGTLRGQRPRIIEHWIAAACGGGLIRAGAREVARLDPHATHGMLVSGDLPALRGEMIDWLAEQTQDSDTDIG